MQSDWMGAEPRPGGHYIVGSSGGSGNGRLSTDEGLRDDDRSPISGSKQRWIVYTPMNDYPCRCCGQTPAISMPYTLYESWRTKDGLKYGRRSPLSAPAALNLIALGVEVR
jgi:hypothetical protein